MSEPKLINNPKHWRDRAEETLAKAMMTWEPENKKRLLRIAEEYEALAQRAEEYLRRQTGESGDRK